MSGEILNLRAARKARDRREAEAKAAENRAKFGQTKGQRAVVKADADRIARTLDGAKRED